MQTYFRHLLAKSSDRPEAPAMRETLVGHTLEVVAVVNALIESWGEVFLVSMGLPRNWNGQLRKASLCGAFIHDIGKANHQFQRLVRKRSNEVQAFRHELIALYVLLHFRELDSWVFSDGNDLVRKSALFAALGHHLQIQDGSVLCPREGSGDSILQILTGHNDFADLLRNSAHHIELGSPPPPLADCSLDLVCDDLLSTIRPWIVDAETWWDSAQPNERRFVALVKGLLVAADLAGSALPRKGINAAAWAEETLSRSCLREELEGIATRSLQGKSLRGFQTKVAETHSRISLVRAGCGSGKTTAAYLWASRNATGRKLFFCYPTTGTATEGYADYVLEDKIGARLIHSRAEVDLDDLLGTPDQNDDQQLRIEALAAWDVPLVVCTADTVLGLIQNNRRGLFSFPAIANGAFVFDEVHAYDDRMFGSLLRFLEAFPGTLVLLMTASLPQRRLEALKQVATRLGECIAEIEGPRDMEAIPRYQFECSTADNAWSRIEQTLFSGGKVLWVANTVNRAVCFGKEAVERGLQPVLPYHSRYRYCERVGKHRAVLEAFKKNAAVLAVTTQVCEVSLNLSADLLVTDLASIPALIQRLGRLNRYVTAEDHSEPRTALFLKPGKALPYEASDLERSREWLKRLGSEPVSQADMAEAFLEVVDDPNEFHTTISAWLDGGPFSVPSPLREAESTIPIVRGEDAGQARDSRGRVIPREVTRLAIPMLLGPVQNEIAAWPRLGMAWVAPPGRINYSQEWGATWRK